MILSAYHAEAPQKKTLQLQLVACCYSAPLCVSLAFDEKEKKRLRFSAIMKGAS